MTSLCDSLVNQLMVFPLLIIGRYCEVEHRLIGICTLCFIGCVAGPSLFVHLMIYQNVRKRQIQNQFKFCLGPSTYNMFQRVWHGIYVVFWVPATMTCFNVCGMVSMLFFSCLLNHFWQGSTVELETSTSWRSILRRSIRSTSLRRTTWRQAFVRFCCCQLHALHCNTEHKWTNQQTHIYE